MAKEKTFLRDDNVHITNARAIFRGTTHSMANITSVSSHTVRASSGNHACLVVAAIGTGTFTLLAGFLAFMAANQGRWRNVWIHGSIAAVATVLLLFTIGALTYARRQSKTNKDTYVVRLRAAGGEIDAFTSHDWDYIYSILQAMNDAMASRG